MRLFLIIVIVNVLDFYMPEHEFSLVLAQAVGLIIAVIQDLKEIVRE